MRCRDVAGLWVSGQAGNPAGRLQRLPAKRHCDMKPPFASPLMPAISRPMSDDPFADPNAPINDTDRRKRLMFRAWRRGFKEADLIMGRFAEARLNDLDAAELDAFERLLDAPDTEVYAWITGRAETPANFDGPVLDALKGFRHEAIVSDGPGE